MINKEIIIRRLALVKYLYLRGVETSKQSDLVAGFSILSFHDCIEMFLILAAENRNVKNFKSIPFMQFWNEIPELTLRSQIEALKDRRVAIKHRGQFPSRQDIDISRINTTDFLEENTLTIFGMNFYSISLADMIVNDAVKTLIKSAESKLAEGDVYGSLCESRLAFHILFTEYESNKSPHQYWDSLLNVGKSVKDEYKKLVGNDSKLGADWFKRITETTNQLRDILKYTALGVDYRKYVLFMTVTPDVTFYCKQNEYGVEPHFLKQEIYEATKYLRSDNAQFCIDFIIECSLKIQDFDFDVSKIYKSQDERDAYIAMMRSKNQNNE